MSAAGTTHVECPECDVLVPITAILRSPTRTGGQMIVEVESDLTDVMIHIWAHEIDLELG